MSQPRYVENFATLAKAFQAQDVALCVVPMPESQEDVGLICTINRRDNGEFEFVAFAKMLSRPMEPIVMPSPTSGPASQFKNN